MLAQLDRLGATLERPWLLVMSCRGRALLSAARGDLRASYQELEQALVLHDRLDEPFERARTLVVLGNVLRRDRKKRAAREALESALEIFDQLGAILWEAKTQAELARVGGRAAATTELTPTEQRIAELIASGLLVSGDGGRALHQPQDGAVEPVEDLPQARHPLAARAPGSTGGRRASCTPATLTPAQPDGRFVGSASALIPAVRPISLRLCRPYSRRDAAVHEGVDHVPTRRSARCPAERVRSRASTGPRAPTGRAHAFG